MTGLQREHSLFLRMSWKPASLIAGGINPGTSIAVNQLPHKMSIEGLIQIIKNRVVVAKAVPRTCITCVSVVSCATKNPVYVFMDSPEVNSRYIDCIDSHLSYPILINIKLTAFLDLLQVRV